MKKRHTIIYHISVFVIAQLFWLMLLGLWIYWYVSNYIIFQQVGNKLSPQIVYDGTNVVALVGGIILLVAISFSMSLIFRHLNVQLKLTNLYDNFIASITHELKSPLSSIQLYLETLNSRNVSQAKQKEFIGLMLKDAVRLKNQINSILEISALEQKKPSHNYLVYNAGVILKSVINEAADQFNLPENSVIITGNADCDFSIDKNSIKIVFDNLIDNAIKYSISGLKLLISLECNGKKIIVNFKDNGIGIPVTEQKKIFNKFYRIYGNNIPNVKGTGLGLYRVREIIKNHSGRIIAQSEGINKGTTFRIELPVYKESRNYFIKKAFNAEEKNEVHQ